jgi:hypothetical protein
VKQEFSALSSRQYRSAQPDVIGVDVDHSRPIGEVRYLEFNGSGRLYAVCEIDGSGLEGPLFFSPHVRHRDGLDIELLGLAVTTSPASIGLDPIDAFPAALDRAASQVVYQDGFAGQLIKRAAAYNRSRKHGQPIVIVDLERERERERILRKRHVTPAEMMMLLDQEHDRRPPGKLRHGPVVRGSVLRVR